MTTTAKFLSGRACQNYHRAARGHEDEGADEQGHTRPSCKTRQSKSEYYCLVVRTLRVAPL